MYDYFIHCLCWATRVLEERSLFKNGELLSDDRRRGRSDIDVVYSFWRNRDERRTYYYNDLLSFTSTFFRCLDLQVVLTGVFSWTWINAVLYLNWLEIYLFSSLPPPCRSSSNEEFYLLCDSFIYTCMHVCMYPTYNTYHIETAYSFMNYVRSIFLKYPFRYKQILPVVLHRCDISSLFKRENVICGFHVIHPTVVLHKFWISHTFRYIYS
jgi:hypothetical protein